MTNYIAYYRVSTQRQGTSGLGLESQKRDVNRFTQKCDNCVLGEYTDVESGKNDQRPQLMEAIAHAKRTNSSLLIAKLDRLSRNAAFIFMLRDSGVKFLAVDIPQASDLTISIMAVLAEDERKRISERTSKALQELKARGVKLGTNNFKRAEVQAKATETKKRNAKNNPNKLRAVKYIAKISRLYILDGKKFTLNACASELNEAGIRTPRGAEYNKQNVRRLYKEVLS
jgi:DNA invertase Pin-like site-specific DNA recombinase